MNIVPNRRAARIVAASLVAVGLAVGAGALATSASSNSSEFEGKDVVKAEVDVPKQSPESIAIDVVSDWLVAHPKESAGWAGIRKVGRTALDLYWKGEVPPSLRLAINATGAEVIYQSAKWSSQEFDAVLPKLLNSGIGLTAARPSEDYSAIIAETEDPTDASLPSEFEGLPISYVRGSNVARLAVGRSADTAPFFGGAQAVVGGNICGLGFSVETSGGVRKVVTARHCGQNSTFETPATTPVTIGTSGGGLAASDSVLIANSSLSIMSSGDVYTGSWTSASWLPVAGTRVAVQGDGLCADGAWSGQKCRNEIGATGEYQWFDELGRSIGPGFWATNVDGEAQAGTGDSGSPAIKLYANPDEVRIVGMVNGINAASSQQRTCQGASGRVCSVATFYTQVNALLVAHGVSLTLG